MGIFDLFKPNVEKMEREKDVAGLIKALGHKESSVKRQATEALDKIGWKPSNLADKVHYLIAKGDKDEENACMQMIILISDGLDKNNIRALADVIVKLMDIKEPDPSYGCAQFCLAMLMGWLDKDWDAAIEHSELALQHGSTEWYSKEAQEYILLAQNEKKKKESESRKD